MPKKGATKAPKVSKKQNKSKPKKKKTKVVYQNDSFSKTIKLIADPCGAELVGGSFGTDQGMMGRYKVVHSAALTETSGYFVWCPTGVTNVAANPTRISAVIFLNSNPGATPLNTGADPYGAGAAANSASGATTSMGANAFITGAVCNDYRTVSACIRMLYTGAIGTAAGRVAYLENLPASALLSGAGGLPMSVNNAFSFAAKTSRLTLDPMEVSYRPNEEITQYFRTELDSPLSRIPGAATIPSVSGSRTAGETFFGFAWDGIPYNLLQFESVQNIEWRPDTNQGYVMPVPTSAGKPQVARAMEFLDRNAEGWSTTLMSAGKSGMNQLANAALAGVTKSAVRSLGSMGRMRRLN